MIRPTFRRTTQVLAAVAALVTLAGCGVQDSIVGIHPAPRETVVGAPLHADSAQQIASRVLQQAADAQHASGATAAAQQRAVLTGAALSVAEARSAVHDPSVDVNAPLTRPSAPQVLAISRGTQWPRAILATTLDSTTSVRYLQVMVSGSPTAPFLLAANVPMLSGQSVPALGDLVDGAPLVTTGEGLGVAPQQVLSEYAAALAFPKPAPAAHVDLADSFAMSIRANVAAQARALGALATLTQKHTPIPQDTVAFGLKDGGAIVFGQLTRVDLVTSTAKAKLLNVPADVALLVKKAKVAKFVQTSALESVVLIIPAEGSARLIGAGEQLASAKGA